MHLRSNNITWIRVRISPFPFSDERERERGVEGGKGERGGTEGRGGGRLTKWITRCRTAELKFISNIYSKKSFPFNWFGHEPNLSLFCLLCEEDSLLSEWHAVPASKLTTKVYDANLAAILIDLNYDLRSKTPFDTQEKKKYLKENHKIKAKSSSANYKWMTE